MPRCTSWRPGLRPHTTVHLPPGKCHQCWTPCRAKVPAAADRCDDCARALVQHPSAKVRKMFAESPGLPQGLLELLATDADYGVSLAAQSRLDGIETVSAPVLTSIDSEEWQ